MGDPGEIKYWSDVLDLKGKDFPYINTAKSLIGHCLAGAGSIETVAALLQMRDGFIHGNKNSEDLHPEIEAIIDRDRVPVDTITRSVNIVGKSSFGFGDVNAVMFFSKF